MRRHHPLGQWCSCEAYQRSANTGSIDDRTNKVEEAIEETPASPLLEIVGADSHESSGSGIECRGSRGRPPDARFNQEVARVLKPFGKDWGGLHWNCASPHLLLPEVSMFRTLFLLFTLLSCPAFAQQLGFGVKGGVRATIDGAGFFHCGFSGEDKADLCEPVGKVSHRNPDTCNTPFGAG